MSKRNLAWVLAIILVAVLFWQMPDIAARRKSVYEVFGPLVDIRAEIHKNYVEQVDDNALLEGAIEGMLQRLDRFSTYIPAEELQRLNRETSGSFEGIGIYLEQQNGVLTVLSPLEDSPAFRAGVMAGDQILEIDGEPTKGMNFAQAARKLMGKPGTKVTIRVRQQLTGQTRQITLTRSVIELRSVKGYIRNSDGSWNYMLDAEAGIGYVRITGFAENTANELDAAFSQLQKQDVRGLILDLRFNPGGLLDAAVDTANRFLDEGVIVSTRRRLQAQKVWHATKANTYPFLPMVVLINQGTASAAEIVSGALKDHHRATLVGVRTFGKGSVQTLREIKSTEGAVKLTTAYYYLPSGRNIHRRDRPGRGATTQKAEEWGVDPDVELPLTAEQQIEVQKARREADIIHPRLPTTTAAGQAQEVAAASEPKPVLIDPQLQKAIDILCEKLRGQLVRGGGIEGGGSITESQSEAGR